MKRIFLTTLALLLGFLTEAQLPSNARLIAGTPDYFNFTGEWMNNNYYVIDILKPQGDSLVPVMKLCDSLDYVWGIYHYSYCSRIVAVVLPKSNAYEMFPGNPKYGKLITINTKDSDTTINILPQTKTIKGEKYMLSLRIYPVTYTDSLRYYITYLNRKAIFFYFLTPETGKMQMATQNVFPNHFCTGGYSTCIYFQKNSDEDYLYFNIDKKDNKVHFYALNFTFVPIDQKYLQNLYYGYVSVNNPRVMVVSFADKDKNLTTIVQDKETHNWRELKIDNFWVDMYFQNYGDWLTCGAGSPVLTSEKYIGQDQWRDTVFGTDNSETPYSPSIMEIMYENCGRVGPPRVRFYRNVTLYLYHIPTGKLISWHTGQVDSEILNVRKDTVYYRVYDAIYAAPIIDGERLGTPKLLIRHKYIPAVHWMYFEGE